MKIYFVRSDATPKTADIGLREKVYWTFKRENIPSRLDLSKNSHLPPIVFKTRTALHGSFVVWKRCPTKVKILVHIQHITADVTLFTSFGHNVGYCWLMMDKLLPGRLDIMPVWYWIVFDGDLIESEPKSIQYQRQKIKSC